MRFLMAALLLLAELAWIASPAACEDAGPSRLGVGFRSPRAPVGIRWWYTRDAALDAAVGFTSTVNSGVRLNRYVTQVAFPFVLHHWSRFGAQLRPGFEYTLEDQIRYPAPYVYSKAQDHFVQANLEIEAEAFLVDHLSVSGSFGVAMAHRNFGETGIRDETSWSTLGGNFSEVGFHFYFGPGVTQ